MKSVIALSLWAILLWQAGKTLSFDFTLSIGTVISVLTFLGGGLLVWFRFGRYAEKFVRDMIDFGKRLDRHSETQRAIVSTLDGIGKMLERHDVRLTAVEKDMPEVESRIMRRLERMEDKA